MNGRASAAVAELLTGRPLLSAGPLAILAGSVTPLAVLPTAGPATSLGSHCWG
ncbi:hypothetical protein ACF1FC_30385 [Streptomyces sp. NPDC014344]|uniref:hypothetical protein n=1 Tax=Streptomyces sp. NPDC014344 TaxID=3364871 RepID=UPI0036FE352B